jgi:hypothetical protein
VNRGQAALLTSLFAFHDAVEIEGGVGFYPVQKRKPIVRKASKDRRQRRKSQRLARRRNRK